MSAIRTMLLAGGGLGLGLLAIWRGLRPPVEPLGSLLARLQPTISPLSPTTPMIGELAPAEPPGWLTRSAGTPLARLLTGLGVQPGGQPADLAITGRSAQRHLADKVATALAGLLLPFAFAGLFWLAAIPLPLTLPAWIGLACAVGGWLIPAVALRQEAARRRAEVRYTLGAILDLTGIALAGGAGVDSALHDAAHAGTDWVSAELRRALAAARLGNQPPWAALGGLGERLAVPELVELAATAGLAGTEGARIRASLLAKAASLRGHQLADAEADAHAATERMSLPVVVLFAAFLVFIGAPAVLRVLGGAPP